MRTLPITRPGTIKADSIPHGFAEIRMARDILIQRPQGVVEELDVVARRGGGTLERRDAIAAKGAVGVAPVDVGDLGKGFC